MESPSKEKAESGPTQADLISTLHNSSLQLFPFVKNDIHQHPSTSDDLINQFRRDYISFGFWGIGHGVATGHLDHKLDHCRNLREDVATILLQILETLYKCLTLSKQNDVAAFTEIAALIENTQYLIDSDSTSISADLSLLDALEDLNSGVSALDDLSVALKDPVPDSAEDSEKPRAPAEVLLGSSEFYFEIIQHRFPKAEARVVAYHSNANYQRLCRLQHLRLKIKAGDENAESEVDSGEVHVTKEEPVAPLPNRASSRFGRSLFGRSQFQDSGLGSSIGTKSSRAESVVSMLRSRRYDKLLPKMPRPSNTEEDMVCNICFSQVTCTTSTEWNKHVIQDIRPYICLYHDCADDLLFFESRQAWLAHLANHFERFKEIDGSCCPLCLSVVGDAEKVFAHLEQHLLEIALLVCPTNEENDDDDSSSASSSHRRTVNTTFEAATAGHLTLNIDTKVTNWQADANEAERSALAVASRKQRSVQKIAQGASPRPPLVALAKTLNDSILAGQRRGPIDGPGTPSEAFSGLRSRSSQDSPVANLLHNSKHFKSRRDRIDLALKELRSILPSNASSKSSYSKPVTIEDAIAYIRKLKGISETGQTDPDANRADVQRDDILHDTKTETTERLSKRYTHKLAEQGRRNRINAALMTLRTLIPMTVLDGQSPKKSAILETAVTYIKTLQETADTGSLDFSKGNVVSAERHPASEMHLHSMDSTDANGPSYKELEFDSDIDLIDGPGQEVIHDDAEDHESAHNLPREDHEKPANSDFHMWVAPGPGRPRPIEFHRNSIVFADGVDPFKPLDPTNFSNRKEWSQSLAEPPPEGSRYPSKQMTIPPVPETPQLVGQGGLGSSNIEPSHDSFSLPYEQEHATRAPADDPNPLRIPQPGSDPAFAFGKIQTRPTLETSSTLADPITEHSNVAGVLDGYELFPDCKPRPRDEDKHKNDDGVREDTGRASVHVEPAGQESGSSDEQRPAGRSELDDKKDQGSQSDRKRIWKCPAPECLPAWFSRKSDLDRHYARFHERLSYTCPISSCTRSRRPFSWKNKLMEHIRAVYPEETIIKCRISGNEI